MILPLVNACMPHMLRKTPYCAFAAVPIAQVPYLQDPNTGIEMYESYEVRMV